MPLNYVRHVRDALAWLKPHDVRQQVEQPVRIGLHGANDLSYFHMESFLAGQLSEARRAELAGTLVRAGSQPAPGQYDIDIWSEELPAPPGAFRFSWHNPDKTVNDILDAREDLELRLARCLCPFRQPAARRIIRRISRENAMFSVATALPDIVPMLSIP